MIGQIAARSGSMDPVQMDSLRRSLRVQFGLDKRNSLPAECLQCEWYRVCHGECPKHRFAKGSDGKPKNYLCEGLRAFYAHVAPAMHHMAAAFF